MSTQMKTAKGDMTQGNICSSLLLFAFPLFVGNIFQQIYNVADTAIASNYLGSPAVAAIGATSTIYSLLICLANGFNSGFGIIVAREYGAKNTKGLRKSVAAMISMNLFITVFLTIFSLLFLRTFMKMLNTPEEIFAAAYSYIFIILAGLAATVTYNMCAGFLRALGNSKTSLRYLIISSIINVFLNVMFIAVFRTGVWGAALATVISEIISSVLCIIYIRKHYKDVLPEKQDFIPEKKRYTEMFQTGFAMALMLSVFSIGSIILQSAINRLGTEIITAHTASRKIIEMMTQPLSTVAVAGSTFTSQNRGAGNYKRIRSSLKIIFVMQGIWSMFVFLIALFFGRQLLMLLSGTTDSFIINNAYMNLRINTALFFPLGLLLAMRTSMQALGCKVEPVLTSGLELLMKVVSTYLVIPVFGYVGASLTEPLTWVVCPIFLGAAFFRKRKELLEIRNELSI